MIGDEEGMKVRFEIPGEPKGKARPRFSNGRTYTPKPTTDYEKHIRNCFDDQCGEITFGDAKIAVKIVCFYGIPKNTSKKKISEMLSERIRPTKKPDLDNVAKIVCDALNKYAYDDDAQIVQLNVSKHYGTEPKLIVEIREC